MAGVIADIVRNIELALRDIACCGSCPAKCASKEELFAVRLCNFEAESPFIHLNNVPSGQGKTFSRADDSKSVILDGSNVNIGVVALDRYLFKQVTIKLKKILLFDFVHFFLGNRGASPK
jgi:hypothetical protein